MTTTKTISVSKFVDMDVDIDLDDVIEGLTPKEAESLYLSLHDEFGQEHGKVQDMLYKMKYQGLYADLSAVEVLEMVAS